MTAPADGGKQLELMPAAEVEACDVLGAAAIRRALHALAVQGEPPVAGNWAGGYAATPLLATALGERRCALLCVRQARRSTNEGRRTGVAWEIVDAWRDDPAAMAAQLQTWPPRSARSRGHFPEYVPGYGDLAGWGGRPGEVIDGIRRDAIAWLRWTVAIIDAASA